jgi:hypothetical protein
LRSILPAVQGAAVQRLLLKGVALDPVLDLPEHALHQHGLRAQPAAPDAAEDGGEQHDHHEQGHHCDGEQVEVGWPEDAAEDDELSFQDVHHQQGFTADADERAGEHDQQEDGIDQQAGPVQRAPRLARVQPDPLAFAVSRGKVVTKVVPVRLV